MSFIGVRILSFVMAAGFALPALACDPEAPPIADEEFFEQAETFRAAEDGLSALGAYTKMLRSRNVPLLDEAIRQGMTSAHGGVRAASLQCIMIRANSVTIRALPYADALKRNPALTEDGAALVEKGYTATFPITAKHYETSCVSLYNTRDGTCHTSYQVSSRDSSVTLIYDRGTRARFELEEDGTLVGKISVWNGSAYDSFPGVLAFN